VLGAQLGTGEILIVLGVVIFLFGAKRLPNLARAIGRSVREIRDGAREDGEPDE
jgi:sec-independent protein translocase protein TatA